jgi:hypothetical protein
MAQYLAKDFINLSRWRLGTNRTAKLGFYHGKGSLHIRPLVVVLHKGFSIEVVEMPHSMPQAIIASCGTPHSPSITFEGDITCAAYRLDCDTSLIVNVLAVVSSKGIRRAVSDDS